MCALDFILYSTQTGLQICQLRKTQRRRSEWLPVEVAVHIALVRSIKFHTAGRDSIFGSLSSARTTKRLPSQRCASTIQIVRPLESIAETQPQLHPALLRFVSDDFPVFHLRSSVAPLSRTAWLSYRSCGAREATRLLLFASPYLSGVFGAVAASFWKRGSLRSGSNMGSSRSSAGVSGTFSASAP